MSVHMTSYALKLAFLKFIGGYSCFKFLRSRLPEATVKKLNHIVGLKSKIVKTSVNISFLEHYIENDRYPKQFFKSIRQSKLKPSSSNLKRHAESHLQALNATLVDLRGTYSSLMPVVDSLSLFCRIKFYNYCKSVTSRATIQQEKKNGLSLSNEDTISNFPKNVEKYVENLSNINLNKIQMEALSVGLKFGIPPHRSNFINVQTQFECLFEQMKSLSSTSPDAVTWLKSRLVDLAYQYQHTPISQSCLLSKEHIHQLKELQRNPELIILPPDKGSGVVLLNRTDYGGKLHSIVSDASKFVIDPDQTDSVQKIERKVTQALKSLHSRGVISNETLNRLTPKGSVTPRMYGLPKTHKPDVPI